MLSPELAGWLNSLPPAEVRKLASFGGGSNPKLSAEFLAGLGDDGLRALDARFRASLSGPATPPADPTLPPSAGAPGAATPEAPPVPPAPPEVPPSPEVAAPTPATEPGGAGGLSPRSPTATDPRISRFERGRRNAAHGIQDGDPDRTQPRADAGWFVKLRNRKALSVGLNANQAHLTNRRASGPFPQAFVQYMVDEFGESEFQITREP